ncbi:hypothetical protein KAM339_026060 [Aeromonas caviae]|uniref:DUF4406 domain-containing protein n=1 Tax=Aeromonas caviae TaxID=648 RepID=UPI001CC72AE9|nr:DUF4406 domain-containing protein [Aeromonas caviae]BDA14065.1 hypothetical protein KAM339_026060 [Aeromonas caviae]
MSNQRRKRIYIAGPMSGIDDCNRPAFHAEALHQQQKGHIVLNPATLPDGLTQQQYMGICIEMVKIADEVIMLPNWVNSQGATAEFHLAMKCGKVIRQAEDGFAWYPTSPEVAA